MVERVFLVKVVKILITDLASDGWLVGCNLVSHDIPVEAFEEGMNLNLFGSVAAEAHLWVRDQLVKDIGGVWR